MAVDTSVIGRPTARFRVVVERGPVTNFATAVTDKSPVYREPAAAAVAGFKGIPAPPTFPFAARNWGAHPELQADLEPVESDPVGEVLGALLANGGLILHGEQSFEYQRPIVVGDVLRGEGRLVDLYEKESKGRTMTFLVVETAWTDDTTGELVLTERMNLIHRS
ncbi:MAG TPA: MaoC family dehydratase N-terminal domain-containing protein [Acidimicrobiales bacterium]|jgi:acyl dehydratase